MIGRSDATGGSAASEVFAFLARYYRVRFSRAAAALDAAGVPLLVLLFGSLVAVILLSLFVPIISLIHAVTPPIGVL
jgi:type II secretory pathway component PulF